MLPALLVVCSVGLNTPMRGLTRRAAVTGGFVFASSSVQPGAAFPNGVPEMALYRSQKKTPGTAPKLGLKADGRLALCDYAPNCFSTSGDEEHLLTLWKPKSGTDTMAELVETIKAYPPGQAGVDKGGFSIVTLEPKYVYVQFESLKYGFIDDVEFALDDSESIVQVRSASREGYLDFGVNGKRLNWISAKLRAKGWTAPAITKATHPAYFAGEY